MRKQGFGDVAWTIVGTLTATFCGIVAILGFGYLGVIAVQGDLGCGLPGDDSNYGDLTWSALPPGPVCTYTTERNGVDKVDGPSPFLSLWLIVVASSALFSVWAFRRAREAQTDFAAHPN